MIEKRALAPELQVLAAFFTAEKLMPAKAFAALIGIKPETEAQMRARRRSPAFFRVGSATFYRFEDVADWLKRSRVECDAQAAARNTATRDLLK